MKLLLNNEERIPNLGFGTFRISDLDATDAVKYAIETGYRHIDTAAIYENEKGVGEGIKKSKIKREDIYLTTKLWLQEQSYKETIAAFEQSCMRLNTDYIDLYLIHWPTKKFMEQWIAMVELYNQGRIKSIGVSNFHQHHLEELLSQSSIVPAVNQIELHPHLTQKELISYNDNHGIKTESWSPLMKGKIMEIELLTKLAKKYNKTQAQITLRWHIQNGIIAIPKSENQSRIKENFSIFDFELTNEDMIKIDDLNQNKRIGSNPDTLASEKFDL